MAQDPKKAKEFADATRVAAEAVEDTNQLVRNLGGLLEKRIAQAKKFNLAMGNTVDSINAMKSDTQDLGGLLEKLVKVKVQEKKTENDIASAFKKKGGFAQGYNQHILNALKTNKAGLVAEKESVITAIKKDEVLSGLIQKAKSIREALTLAGIIKLAIATAQKFGERLDSIGQQFGSLNVLGKELNTTLLNSSVQATRLGGGIQDVATITNTLASNFGMSLEEASKLSSKIFDTGKAIGLSADESATLFGALTQVANLSAEQAESLAEGTFQLARQNGVAPSAVLRDVASSAETIALFTKDGGDNIGEAAIQARQLGLNLDTTAKIAEGLLDFESSITKEVEASVMIGRQLNLQKAREAALSGDIASAMEEVVKQVGSEQDFLNLNLIQRKALADSIGVSVGEMAKLVGETGKLDGSLGDGFRDLLGEETLSNFSKLTNNVKSLTEAFIVGLGPALEVIVGGLAGFTGILASGLDTLNKMGATIPLIGTALTAMAAKSVITTGVNLGLFTSKFLTTVAALGPLAIPLAATALGGAIALIGKAKNVNDFHTGPGGITTMMGPAGIFSLNPRDSVLATTNPIPVQKVNDSSPGGLIPVNNNTGDFRVTVRADGIENRTIQQLVDVEFTGTPGSGMV